MKFEGSTLNFTYDASGTPLTMSIDGTVYYYVTNLQGDVVGLLDTTGARVVTYTYDAWGVGLTVTGTKANSIGMLNPLRYRGYVYDVETGLYYLQSRYYDPQVGRFLNADIFYSTGQGFVGNNMFAYCGNTPVSNYDPTGNYYAKAEDRITTGCSGRGGAPASTVRPNSPDLAPQPNPEPNGFIGFIGFINFITNTDEQVVLDADNFAMYKGVPVIKIPAMGGNAFSFGIILMGNDVTSEDVVQHEYGHAVHLMQIGMTSYTKTVVIPSLIGFWGGVPYDLYYSQPWEHIADILGGVARDGYDYMPGSDVMAVMHWLSSALLRSNLP